MNKEKINKLIIRASEALSTNFTNFSGRLSNRIAKEWAFREACKKIFKESTKTGLFAKDRKVNDSSYLLWTPTILTLAVVMTLFIHNFMSNMTYLLIPITLLIPFWEIPKWNVEILCNPIFKETASRFRNDENRTKILLGIQKILLEMEESNLVGYRAEHSNGYRSLDFDIDSRYGLVCRIKITKKGQNKLLSETNYNLFQRLYLIPSAVDEYAKPTIISNSVLEISLDHFIENSWEDFLKEVVKDEEMANRIPFIRKKRKEEKAEQKKVERQTQEQQKFEKIEVIVRDTGVNLKVLPILQKIIQNRDIWNVSPSNLEKYLEGNDFFAKFRLNLIHNEEFNQFKKRKETLERLLNCDITIGKIPTDKSSVNILLGFKNTLEPYNKTYSEILEINLQDKLYLGKTMQGDLIAGFNSRANHFLVTGESGSGKSRLIVHLLTQLLNMNEFRFGSVYIGSVAKLSDYVAFEQAGSYLTEGTRNVSLMVSGLLKRMRQREFIFKQHNVKNIEEYNSSVHPDEKMERIVLVLEEFESTLVVSSRRELEEAVLALLSIGRSSGVLVIISSQSLQKSHIGAVRDKIMTQFIGYMKRKTAQDCNEPELGDYFGNLEGESQGVFFLDPGNLQVPKNQYKHKTTNRILVQFPLAPDIENYIPEVKGSKLGFDAVNDTEKGFGDIMI